MKFDDAGQIVTQVTQLLLAQSKLMNNRALINRVFNGEVPLTPEQQEEQNVNTNVNFLQGTKIASNAVNQLNSAFFKSGTFFSVRLDVGPPRLRPYWSAVVTAEINKLMKRSRSYRSARQSAHKQVVLHGPGPMLWTNRRSPLPGTGAIEDVLLPMGTYCDFNNLDRFAIYKELTWPQLHEMAFGDAVDKGWNKPYVRALCDTLYHQGYVPIYQGNRWMFPEKLAEDYKSGAAYTFSSSLPKVLAWDFFYRNDKSGKWNRRLVLDYSNMAPAGEGSEANWEKSDVYKEREVLYSMDDYADEWSNVIHWYVGNCSNVGPDRYHSIRSIGYLLYAIVQLDNRMRNRTADYTFTQLLYLLRNVSDDNREKLGLVDLQNFGVVPDGVSFVNANERYECDPNLILMALNQNKQLMAESSSAFISDLPGAPGGSKEMTATEALIRQNTSTTLTSAVIGQLADDSLFEYMEIARRFAMPGNPDPVAKAFRKAIEEQGVPKEVLDFERWEIVPEMSQGSGNKAMELTASQAMMRDVYPLVGPDQQRLILRNHASALSDNPDFALTLVPEMEQQPPDLQVAQTAFAVLMEGAPYQPPQGADPVVLSGVLMGLVAGVLNQAEAAVQQPAGLGMAADKVAGAANVLQFVQGAIQQVAQGASLMESRKQLVKQLAKQFELLQGELQQLAKAVMAAEEQQQPQVDSEQAKLQAKLQDMQASGEMKRQIDFASAEQKRQQKSIAWSEENQRRNANTAADIERTNAKTVTDLRTMAIKAQADAVLKLKQAQEKEKAA